MAIVEYDMELKAWKFEGTYDDHRIISGRVYNNPYGQEGEFVKIQAVRVRYRPGYLIINDRQSREIICRYDEAVDDSVA